MKKTILILSIFAFIASSCGKATKQNIEKMDKYVGIYEYVYPFSSEENQYIVLKEENGKIIGFYYGTSDEFDEAREGYSPAFFVAKMDQLEINGNSIQFVLNVNNSDFLTKPIDFQITSTQEAIKSGYKNWRNGISTEPKKYVGFLSADEGTIFFKKINAWEDDKKFTKQNFNSTKSQKAEDFVPNDEKIIEKIVGDLNGDGENDVVIITQQTKKSAFVVEYGTKFDRNRRGIIIAFKKDKGYELALSTPDCFDGEPTDDYQAGGTSISVKIETGKLNLRCTYGRYGVREYTFRYQNNAFELIGFDSVDRIEEDESIIFKTTSLNFLTKKMKVQTDIIHWCGEEELTDTEKTSHNIEVKKLATLTDINFDKGNVTKFYKLKK